ncbi:MAG: hypothetical protein V2A76_10990 [Planctomycetota bacterium]
MGHRRCLVIACLSVTLVALELAWTRLFSAEYFHTCAFLILSLAILGLGLGALSLRMLPALGREGAVGPLLSLTALAALSGPPLAFLVNVDMEAAFCGVGQLLRLVLTLAILGSSFFFGGAALASLFRRHHEELPRPYRGEGWQCINLDNAANSTVYTFFIGASVYSIGTVLLTLLLASGTGSRYSERAADRTAFLGIVVWLLLDVFVFTRLIHELPGLAPWARMGLTALLLAPLGFFMGMPFPQAGRRVKGLIDWGFAVNGAASVWGATVVLLVSFSLGFGVALMVAAGLYLLSYLLLWRKTAW